MGRPVHIVEPNGGDSALGHLLLLGVVDGGPAGEQLLGTRGLRTWTNWWSPRMRDVQLHHPCAWADGGPGTGLDPRRERVGGRGRRRGSDPPSRPSSETIGSTAPLSTCPVAGGGVGWIAVIWGRPRVPRMRDSPVQRFGVRCVAASRGALDRRRRPRTSPPRIGTVRSTIPSTFATSNGISQCEGEATEVEGRSAAQRDLALTVRTPPRPRNADRAVLRCPVAINSDLSEVRLRIHPKRDIESKWSCKASLVRCMHPNAADLHSG